MPKGQPIIGNPIDDLKAYYEKTGGNFGYKEYQQNGGRFSRNVFRRRFGSWNNALKIAGIEPLTNQFHNYLEKPDFPIEEFTAFPRINADKIDVWFDLHLPYHDVSFCNEALGNARKRGVKTLIIGGDFIDFKGLYKKETQQVSIDWIEELGEACRFLEGVTQIFKEVHIIMGNHDWRLVRYLENNKRANKLYALIFRNPQIKFSKYFFALLNDWLYIVHPDNMRKAKLSLPEELCDNHRKSVITAHSHRFAFGSHDYTDDIVGDGLTMTNVNAHEYRGLKLTTYSGWVQGFWIVEGGKVAPYVKHKRIMNLL